MCLSILNKDFSTRDYQFIFSCCFYCTVAQTLSLQIAKFNMELIANSTFTIIFVV